MEQKLSRRPHIQPRVHRKYMGVSKFDDITSIGKQILRYYVIMLVPMWGTFTAKSNFRIFAKSCSDNLQI
jgi:hypothetical protein